GTVVLDDLHPVLGFDGFGQALADIAAAGDHEGLVVLLDPAHFAHYRTDILGGGNEEDLVIGYDQGIALGGDRAVTAEDRRDPRCYIGHVLAQIAQLLTDQRPAIDGLHGHQLHLAAGKVQNLQRARILDQPLDVGGDRLFRADQYIDRHGVVLEQLAADQVGRLADPGDLGRRTEQRSGHLARDHVGLVAAADRNQHIGIIGTGLAQYRRQRAAALYRADVQAITQRSQAHRVHVHDGHIVGLAGQLGGQTAADLPCTENDDFHA